MRGFVIILFFFSSKLYAQNLTSDNIQVTDACNLAVDTLDICVRRLNVQTHNSGIFQRSVANVSIKVDADRGARIASLQIDGNEILYLDTTDGYWGSTFWPSPQSAWDWPPPAKIDTQPYAVCLDGNKIILKSDVDEITRLRIHKTISTAEKDTSITLRYTMVNHDTVFKKFAPWEITRVPSSGLVFAAKNSDENDFMWFDLNAPFTEKSKVNSEGEGWQAYVNNDGYILIKIYPDILPEETAPGEGEFELYRDKNIYVELENQGRYLPIEPGDSLVWEVKWYLRKLPGHIEQELRNKQLIEYVLQFVNNKKKSNKDDNQ